MDDNSLQPRGLDWYDRLGKLRPLISHFTHTFADLYEPNKELTVDEAMIKFTGPSLLKQYMSMKPVKLGINVWVLADSHYVYFSKFQVYTGKNDGAVEKGLGTCVVKDLTNTCTSITFSRVPDRSGAGWYLLLWYRKEGSEGVNVSRGIQEAEDVDQVCKCVCES